MFEGYWRNVASALNSGELRDKSTCIKLGCQAGDTQQISALVSALFRTMQSADILTRSTANWIWRNADVPANSRQQEVWVERQVCIFGNRKDRQWTYQLPVASGIGGAGRNRRRSIDLAHRISNDHFEFIELKWASGCRGNWGADNPLYAAFEILGYGLAYLVARKEPNHPRNADEGASGHVFQASHIDLKVLAPEPYFSYKKARGAIPTRYELAWLQTGINDGLRKIVPSALSMTFAFCWLEASAGATSSRSDAADAIVAGKYLPLYPLSE